ncbi:MAG: T9SS type A sorting domain-containing protein [Ignavibacteria bacterium]|nr:T9SS type A sorting domain-containing protein [Ignavibacteria bacterium]
MQKWFLQRKNILFTILFAMTIVISPSSQMYGQLQKADLPRLSLTGTNNGYLDNLYSDGRIWLGYSDIKEREVIVPVYIQNLWAETELVADKRYGGFPIYNFSFIVLYDGRVMQSSGVQVLGPKIGDPEALAKGFTFEWDDIADDKRFRVYLTGAQDAETKYGRRLMVTGISTRRLPLTDPSGTYSPLLYLKFRVTLTKSQLINQSTTFSGSDKTPLYITNDSLRYGDADRDFRVGIDDPFPKISQGDATNPYGNKFYRVQNNPTIGLAGITVTSDVYPDYPSRPGIIWVNVGENPSIGFRDVIGGTNNEVKQDDNTPDGSLWEVVRTIVVDSASNTGRYGTRDIQLINLTSRSRLTNVLAQSSEPWLYFRSLPNGYNPIRVLTREGNVDYIDNGINGPVPPNLKDARNNIKDAQQPIGLRITCNSDELRKNGEYAGVYTGYITFTSYSAVISPVRLKVVFIFFRNPLEPYSNPSQGRDWGIRINVKNSKGISGETNDLVFGTGHRATDGPDSLFGEDFYRNSPVGFYARWFNTNLRDINGNEIAPFGFSEIPIESEGVVGTRSVSRDIRDNATDTTISFLCRFNADNASNYPIVVSWDTQDFPQGAQLFMRDTINGTVGPKFSVDMRNATGGGSPTSQYYTIRDARITSFIIEYTLPKVVSFPVINSGWNLLSLPVKPSNSSYTVVYPNSEGGQPFRFYANSYQNQEFLEVGYGYFVRYGKVIDTKIAGTRISNINANINPVLLTKGWNTIGSLSTVVNVTDINFDPVGQLIPTTKPSTVWGYQTDRGYNEVSEIQPGLGYWLKVDEKGYLKMKATGIKYNQSEIDVEKQNVINSSDKLNVVDNGQHQAELYLANNDANVSQFELPPTPPYEMFDVRFGNDAKAENSNVAKVRFQGVQYPVAITVQNPTSNYTVIDLNTGKSLGVINSQNTTVTITNTEIQSVKLLKTEMPVTGYSIETIPNPANGLTNVKYAVPQNSFVTLKVYNMLGVEVATLVQEFKNAGGYEVPFTTSSLPSGQYTVRVVAGEFTVNSVLSVVR